MFKKACRFLFFFKKKQTACKKGQDRTKEGQTGKGKKEDERRDTIYLPVFLFLLSLRFPVVWQFLM